jgi:N-acetylmuramoyl-L-alanine amidase
MSIKQSIFVLSTLIYFFYASAFSSEKFILMIDPAGDAKHAGREIDDYFERGIALQCAEKLKYAIEKEYPFVSVVLSRFPGESLEPLQNAHFANRLSVDLYISIHFYQNAEEKPALFIYQCAYNKVTDFWPRMHDTEYKLVPYDQIHISHTQQSKHYAEQMISVLQQYQQVFDIKGLFVFPFKPLIAINAPALAFEISLKTKNDWQSCIEPITKSLKSIILQKISS